MAREAQSYQYLNDKFEVLTSTSIPLTDKEALEYFSIIQLQWWEDDVTYITKRGFDPSDTYKMLPYRYDRDAKEVIPFED